MNIPASLAPVADWKQPERAWFTKYRGWLPAVPEFRNAMLGEVPPIQWHHAPGFGSLFAVGEIWRHHHGELVLLWFRAKPLPACRLATAREIAAEVLAQTRTQSA